MGWSDDYTDHEFSVGDGKDGKLVIGCPNENENEYEASWELALK